MFSVDGAGVEPASRVIGAPHRNFSHDNITARMQPLNDCKTSTKIFITFGAA